ncbi:MAG: hypothetical protein ABW065_13660 [Solirubrobacterales bacterium]
MILLVLIAAAAAIAVLPASASAAPCPVNPGNATSWTGLAGNGSFGDDGNWSNGTPSGSCDVSIITPGNFTVTMTSGANMKSLTLGGVGSTPTVVISAQSPNTNLSATTTGITIAAGAGITLTCPPSPGECLGGPSGGAGLNAGTSTIANAGTIKVAADSGTGAALTGSIVNTGTMQFDQNAHLGGAVINKGQFGIADGKTVTSSGSSCGDTSDLVKNDVGGLISAAGSGTLSVINYEQGNGSTSGANPVQLPCGSLKYTGTGDSKVRASAGFNLTGTMQANQSLTVSAESPNTNVALGGDFVNNGSITLTCPPSPGECLGGPSGGAGFNANGHAFTNVGSFTVAAASGTGASLSGGFTNTGTMQFDQNAHLGGAVVNKGQFGIADGKTVTSSGSSCGDGSDLVKNDVGGLISAAGSGTLNVINYEQGNGTTSGNAPVQMNCGSLKYTGTGAGTVQVNGTLSMTGNLAAGQVLRIPGQVNSSPFASAGTIVLPSGGTLNASLTNSGRLTGLGTVSGSVDNASGVVAPGASPGILTVNGSYTQGTTGSLEVEVEGTGAGQFDKLAVGGNATLGGTLALLPSAGFASAASIGTKVDLLTYGGSRSGQFGQVTANPTLACPKQFTATYDDGAKKVAAVVADSGSKCGGGEGEGEGGGSGGGASGGNGGGGSGSNAAPAAQPLAASAPETTLGSHPRATVKTRKAKVSVSFSFSANQAGASFQCKLDKGAFQPCTSPRSFKAKPGKHTFSVRAVGPGGSDATPATFTFTVVKLKRR